MATNKNGAAATRRKAFSGAEIAARAIRLEKCRSSLWEFQKQRNPKFFKDSRPHLKQISDVLQGVFERKMLKPDGSPYRKVVLSIPPRHGKSYSLAGFKLASEHLYPVMDDSDEERAQDLSEVAQQARSRKSFITKWQPDDDPDAELGQILREKQLLEDAYEDGILKELRGV